jgi:tetratricopeptide (TPR) repeat protein
MSFIKGNVALYLCGAFFSGCAGAIADFKDDQNIIIGFILAFIFAPLVASLGLLGSLIERSDIKEEHTKQLKEVNEKRRQKLERLCDLGAGLKRGETLSALDWVNKGRSYAEAKSFDAAISCFDSALVLDHDNEDVWVSRSKTLLNLGRYDEAIACCDRALNINPNSELTWFNKGICLMKSGRTDEALTCCDKAIEINPNDIDTWIIKGRSLEELSEFEGAINCYDKALKINPEHKMAREYKEACLQKL